MLAMVSLSTQAFAMVLRFNRYRSILNIAARLKGEALSKLPNTHVCIYYLHTPCTNGTNSKPLDTKSGFFLIRMAYVGILR